MPCGIALLGVVVGLVAGLVALSGLVGPVAGPVAWHCQGCDVALLGLVALWHVTVRAVIALCGHWVSTEGACDRPCGV